MARPCLPTLPRSGEDLSHAVRRMPIEVEISAVLTFSPP
jgi:hypothetical protein